MKNIKGAVTLAVVAMLSLVLAGCGGGAGAQSSDGDASASGAATSSAAASSVEQLSKASGAAVHLDANNTQATVDVEVKDGEALVVMGNIEKAEGQVSIDTSKDGEFFSTDSLYEGYGCSEAEVDPGTYSVAIDGASATGTVWAFAYQAGSVDFQSMDTEQIVEHYLSLIS